MLLIDKAIVSYNSNSAVVFHWKWEDSGELGQVPCWSHHRELKKSKDSPTSSARMGHIFSLMGDVVNWNWIWFSPIT